MIRDRLVIAKCNDHNNNNSDSCRRRSQNKILYEKNVFPLRMRKIMIKIINSIHHIFRIRHWYGMCVCFDILT